MRELIVGQPVANAVLVLSLVSMAGLVLAKLRLGSIGIGIAGVLFAGIGFGHYGITIPPETLEFVRDFGLILFVFAIGLQLGPEFFGSLRREGLKLNGLALVVVLSGAVLTWTAATLGRTGFPAAFGLFSGATTNTPSLGAIQQTLIHMGKGGTEEAVLPALAYAASYPGGVVGIIAAFLALRVIFRISPEQEARNLKALRQEPLQRRSLRIDNSYVDQLRISEMPKCRKAGITISRILPAGTDLVRRAAGDTVVHLGDSVLAVGTASNLREFERVVGSASDADLMANSGELEHQSFSVTEPRQVGRRLAELAEELRSDATITRVRRGEIEMPARDDLRLQFGDRIRTVGNPQGLARACALLGNSQRALQVTNFIPIFFGIALGVIAGALPFQFPGIPTPVRLGLAGGPLLLGIILGRLGRLGPVILQMPPSVNLAFRELGMALFLACVGLKAGPHFFETVLSLQGATWVGAGFVITVLPLLAVGICARRFLKMNFMTLSGLLAGSMTDPPALAFACSVSQSDAPSGSYATVYPLAMFSRILIAQLLVLTFG